jgi:hypothetical protein
MGQEDSLMCLQQTVTDRYPQPRESDQLYGAEHFPKGNQ